MQTLVFHSFDSEQILSLVSSSNYHLVRYSSTHHTHATSTLLDLCIVDKLINYEQRDVGFLSAHDLISIDYNIKIEQIPKRTLRVHFDFRSFKLDDFLGEFEFMNWEKL